MNVGLLNGDGQITLDTLLVADLTWPGGSDELLVPAGTYDVGIAAASVPLPTDPLAVIPVPLAEGARAFALAVGDIAPALGEQPFGVYAIVTNTNPWVAIEL